MKKIILLFCCLLTFTMIATYRFFPTEGIRILVHYMFGDGSDLHIESDYIPTSPVVLYALEGMKPGETKKISFKQDKDWRLSYAVNGFDLTKTNNGFFIKQRITFDTTGKVYTYIKTPFGKFKFYDNWVHVVKCRPFTVYFKSDY